MNSLSKHRRTTVRHAAACRLAMLAAVVGCVQLRSVHADPIPLTNISWGSATNITGDSDVDTSGSLVYAYNFGSSSTATSQTINGVTFQPFVIQDYTTLQTSGSVTVSENSGYLVSDLDVGSANTPFTALSESYRALLASEVYASNFANIQVDLGGLTVGESYRLQWWTNDSQLTSYSGSPLYFENTYGSGSSSSVTLDSNTDNANGGLGQFVIGTFTATDTTASFTLTGSGDGPFTFPLMNAMQLRVAAVPEPSTIAMAVAGLACGVFTMLRRRVRG